MLTLLLSGKNPGSWTADLSINRKRPGRLCYSFLCLSSPGGEHTSTNSNRWLYKMHANSASLASCIGLSPRELPNVVFPKLSSMAYKWEVHRDTKGERSPGITTVWKCCIKQAWDRHSLSPRPARAHCEFLKQGDPRTRLFYQQHIHETPTNISQSTQITWRTMGNAFPLQVPGSSIIWVYIHGNPWCIFSTYPRDFERRNRSEKAD